MPSHVNRLAWACVGLAALASGCQDYNWQWNFQSPDQIRALEQRAAEQRKLVFIFYKYSLNDRMHADVLADNQVGALFQDTVNVMIDKFSAGPAYDQFMTRYGITTPPACALVSPDGRYKVFTGYISKDRFMELVKSAKAELKEPARPATGKAVP